MEEGGKRKIVLRRAPPAFGPPPPSIPAPTPPVGPKDQKRRGQAGFIARLGALFLDCTAGAVPLILINSDHKAFPPWEPVAMNRAFCGCSRPRLKMT